MAMPASVSHEVAGAQALRRGLSLLDIVAKSLKPMRFGEIAVTSGLAKGTAHRLLSTLVEAGLLRVEETDQTYRLGFGIFEMAHRVWSDFDLRGAAEPELHRLAEMTGEAVRLAIFDRDSILYVDQRESAAQALRVADGVGTRLPCHAGAAGKALLAFVIPQERERILQDYDFTRFTPATLLDRAALDRDLDLTRARGYAVSCEEMNVGLSSVAAPILDHRAVAIGAVAIVGPSSRLGPERLHGYGRDVMEAARRISGNAGQIAMSLATPPRPLGVDRDDLSLVMPSTCFLGEGPVWTADERLLWLDILAPALFVGDPDAKTFVSHPMPELIGAVAPRRRGGLIAAMQHGFKTLDLETGEIAPFAMPSEHKPGSRFNDGKVDRRGRFWAGTLAMTTAPGEGALYRLDPDGRVVKADAGFHVSNGMGWSPDDRYFYFVDSGPRRIYCYDFDLAGGTIANRRTFVQVPEGEGVPDGLAVDAEGFVWCAHFDGWCVTRYDPDGRVERVINLPVPRPTSCTFGGPDRSTLFITTARIRLSAQQLAAAPLSGSVFALRTGIRSQPETPFDG
jgi:sugar lactone lactonase YvrE/DNA-binding IclR family transcriptional regulator